ncbi:T9SS type A sorting domain-containing protein [Polluticoccus soli]|uniref:T9SS type A sorting domain-containing protein n=1 Tax=Polluticoccus soli TaxID=3034150 RepID=UPI0023E09847|nr:T9SS type A sorting domain-containing protein [Flavipsychrobacter sp. JY13-12]
MKTLFALIFFILFLLPHGYGANLGVDSIRISPTTITKNDSVQIRLYTHTGTMGYQSYLNYSVTPGNIWITSCYKVNAVALITWFADTLNIGKLADGNYQINFLSYVAGDTQCTYIFDSTKVTDSIVVHAPESIDSYSLNQTVYPNPTFGDVNISLPAEMEIIQISLQDVTGRIIKTATGSTLSIAELPTGLYILQAQTNKGRFIEKLRKE